MHLKRTYQLEVILRIWIILDFSQDQIIFFSGNKIFLYKLDGCNRAILLLCRLVPCVLYSVFHVDELAQAIYICIWFKWHLKFDNKQIDNQNCLHPRRKIPAIVWRFRQTTSFYGKSEMWNNLRWMARKEWFITFLLFFSSHSEANLIDSFIINRK